MENYLSKSEELDNLKGLIDLVNYYFKNEQEELSEDRPNLNICHYYQGEYMRIAAEIYEISKSSKIKASENEKGLWMETVQFAKNWLDNQNHIKETDLRNIDSLINEYSDYKMENIGSFISRLEYYRPASDKGLNKLIQFRDIKLPKLINMRLACE